MTKIYPRLLKLIKLSIIIYVLLCLALSVFQRSLIYYPTKETPHPFETQIFSNQGEKIKVTVLNKKAHSNAILFFGGNAENVSKHAKNHLENHPKHTLYLVNYRGYGGSTGQPTESNLFSDALYIFDQIQPNHPKISIMGRSLGTGVASYVAAKRVIDKLVLITPYDSIESIAVKQYPIFPIKWLIKDSFNSYKLAPSIKVETLILIAQNDRVIPLVHSKRLISAFNPKLLEIKIIRNSNHSDISHKKPYKRAVRKFLNS